MTCLESSLKPRHVLNLCSHDAQARNKEQRDRRNQPEWHDMRGLHATVAADWGMMLCRVVLRRHTAP